jgi:DnaJ-class molecular chaperone
MAVCEICKGSGWNKPATGACSICGGSGIKTIDRISLFFGWVVVMVPVVGLEIIILLKIAQFLGVF